MRKKILLPLLALLLVFSSYPSYAKDKNADYKAIEAKVAAMTQEQKEARVAEIKARLEEIKAMDKSQLTREERIALKDEVKYMRKEAKSLGHGGVYISLAGIIIIILVLIIIL